MPTRRRVLGWGLAALGATAAGAGLASGPDSGPAYAAWDGPPDFSDLPDRRLRLAAWARLAPSSYNLQPWRLRLEGEDGLVLTVDPTRLHPVTDPAWRQTTLSQGTFLELLRLAAAGEGLAAEMALFPDGPFSGPEDMESHPVARLRFRRAAAARPPLFSAVLARRSGKVRFNGRAIVAEDRRRLAAAVASMDGVSAGFLDRGPAMERLRALVLEGMRADLTDPETAAETARLTRLTPAAVTARRDGLVPMPGAAGWVADLLYGEESLGRPDSFLNRSRRRQMAGWAESAAAFVWLVTAEDSPAARIAAGRAYMRLDLAAAEAGLAIHPLAQTVGDGAIQAPQRRAVHALLAPGGGRVQIIARLGHADRLPPHTPRRAVRDLVVPS